jgi:hypothetical protein
VKASIGSGSSTRVAAAGCRSKLTMARGWLNGGAVLTG